MCLILCSRSLKRGGSPSRTILEVLARWNPKEASVPADIVLGPGVYGVVSIKLFDKAAT